MKQKIYQYLLRNHKQSSKDVGRNICRKAVKACINYALNNVDVGYIIRVFLVSWISSYHSHLEYVCLIISVATKIFKILGTKSCKVKLQQFLFRPGEVLRVLGGWHLQISRQSDYDGGKVVSPAHRPALPPGNIPGTRFCYGLIRPQGHSAAVRIISMKNCIDTIGFRTRELPTYSEAQIQ